MSKNPIEVGVACIFRDGKYLIQNRCGKSFATHWEFPGGKREEGETFSQCVEREIYEELGVWVLAQPAFYEKTAEFNGKIFKLSFHHSEILEGDPEPMEGQTLQWVSPADFAFVKFLPTNLSTLEILKKGRQNEATN